MEQKEGQANFELEQLVYRRDLVLSKNSPNCTLLKQNFCIIVRECKLY